MWLMIGSLLSAVYLAGNVCDHSQHKAAQYIYIQAASHSKIYLDGAFVRALNSPFRRFPAWAVSYYAVEGGRGGLRWSHEAGDYETTVMDDENNRPGPPGAVRRP